MEPSILRENPHSAHASDRPPGIGIGSPVDEPSEFVAMRRPFTK